MNDVTIANQYNDFLVRSVDVYAEIKYNILLEWLGPSIANKDILVVGSGSGEFACYLAQTGANVHAVDIDENSIKLTQECAENLKVNIKTSIAFLESIPNEKTYDLVVATDVIEHIKDDTLAMLQIYKLTKANGLVVITVPALQSLFGYHDEILGHFRRYNMEQLLKLMRALNIKVLNIRYFGFILIPIAFLVSKLLRKPYPVAQVGRNNELSIIKKLLRFLLVFEKTNKLPLGTSLLFVGKKIA